MINRSEPAATNVMVTFPPLRSTNISLVCVPMDKQTYLLTCGSFETCAHRNGRSIKAKHKTFAKMAKKDFLKSGKDFHYLVGHSGIIVLHDEASTVLLRCKTKKELYCSAQAKFYLLYGDELHPIKACMHGPNWKHTGGCGNYAFIRQVHGNVHKLMEGGWTRRTKVKRRLTISTAFRRITVRTTCNTLRPRRMPRGG